MDNFFPLNDVAERVNLRFSDILRDCIQYEVPIVINLDENESFTTQLFVLNEQLNALKSYNKSTNEFSSYIMLNNWCGATPNFYWGETDVSANTQYELNGYWIINAHYIANCLRKKILPLLKVNELFPYSDSSELLPIRCRSLTTISYAPPLYIDKKGVDKLFEIYLDGDLVPKKRQYSYSSQSLAQKERHAAKRESVLMAAISLYKQSPDICSKNATKWGELLWERRSRFWEDGQAPLSEDEIIKLLRKALKFGL